MSNIVVKESQPAPDFTLPAIGSDDVVKNGRVQLSALRNHVVVLYFYPQDDTPAVQPKRARFAMPIEKCRNAGSSSSG